MTLQLDPAAAAPPWPAAVSARYPHRYAAIDVETTGLAPGRDRVVQVAVVLLDAGGTVESSWSTLVDPERDPGPVHVHGLTAERLRGAPRFAEIAPRLAAMLAGRVFVAHNAVFDWGFVATEVQRAGHVLDVPQRLCTRALARRLDLPVPDLKLATLAAHWGVVQHRAHDAEDDTRVLVEVLRHCLTAAAAFAAELPLTPCSPEAPPARRSSPRPPRAPRVDCPWALPPRWAPGSPLVQGACVVVTGATRVPRTDLVRRAVAAGLDVRDGVSRATALLVGNDPSSRTRKTREALALGVPVVGEEEFERLLTAVAPGVPKRAAAPPPAPPAGPLAHRHVLVLGGPHERAARVRAEVVSRGGSAAVTLTAATTDVVALDGAQADRRWGPVRALGLPLLDPSTWGRATGGAGPADALEPLVLPRGGAVDLPEHRLRWLLDVRWARDADPVDVVALRLRAGGRLAGEVDLVVRGAPATPDGSVVLDARTPGEAEVAVELAALPAEVERVLLAAVLPEGVTFGSVGPLDLTLRTPAGGVFAQATLDAAAAERTLVLGEVHRRGGVWRFRVLGQGHGSGLPELVARHEFRG